MASTERTQPSPFRPDGASCAGSSSSGSGASSSLLIVGLGAAAGIFAAFLRDLPSLDGLEEYQPSVATTLYTDQDEPFHSFYEQRRILVPLAKIPAQLKQAVLAVEDSRFYEHHGLSPRAIARAPSS